MSIKFYADITPAPVARAFNDLSLHWISSS